MNMYNLYDICIIGGGPAGLSAAIYAARSNLKTIILEKSILGGQLNLTNQIENYPGIESINGFDLAKKFIDHVKTYNVTFLSEIIEKIKKEGIFYRMFLSNGKNIISKSVILATGGSPRELKISGEREFYGKGVSYCATCDGFFFKDKNVAVVGGGDVAAEESIFLSKLCKKVYLIHRRNSLRASKILQNKMLNIQKILPIWDTIVTSIISKNNKVVGLNIQNVNSNNENFLKIDGLFIFIGYKPNDSLFLKDLIVDENGFVVTNELCETNLRGFYVAGDLRGKEIRQVVVSAADGCKAAITASKYVERLVI